jgi:hydrophobic/amphiphilic exporter-1 (mainly G- bacteria), HAE1 family
VFLPIVFVEGLTSQLVSGISFTVIVSLLASLLVAMFLIPALSVWLFPKSRNRDVDPGSAKVEALVHRLMARPKTVLLVAAAASGVAVLLLLRLGTDLLPPSDPRQFTMRVLGPPGQRVESTSVMIGQVEAVVAQAAGDDLQAMMAEVGRLDDDDRFIKESSNPKRMRPNCGFGSRLEEFRPNVWPPSRRLQ